MKEQKAGKQPDRIPREAMDRPARAILAFAAKVFEDPATAADFEKWKAERRAKGATA